MRNRDSGELPPLRTSDRCGTDQRRAALVSACITDHATCRSGCRRPWSNQEAGAVAPEQATVRVTYTLRWDAAAGRWLIVETSQMLL